MDKNNAKRGANDEEDKDTFQDRTDTLNDRIAYQWISGMGFKPRRDGYRSYRLYLCGGNIHSGPRMQCMPLSPRIHEEKVMLARSLGRRLCIEAR